MAPRCCSGCERPDAEALCSECVERLQSQPPPVPASLGGVRAHVAFLFAGPAREAIHAAKFGGRPRAMALLAALAAERLAPQLALAAPDPDAVVPVPLSRRRAAERGYNQALIAARAIAAVPCGGPVVDGLVRLRHTSTQVGRGSAERRANLAGAFTWSGSPPRPGGLVWLVDDVLTTGATLGAAADALQRAGFGRIEFVAVGCAP